MIFLVIIFIAFVFILPRTPKPAQEEEIYQWERRREIEMEDMRRGKRLRDREGIDEIVIIDDSRAYEISELVKLKPRKK